MVCGGVISVCALKHKLNQEEGRESWNIYVSRERMNCLGPLVHVGKRVLFQLGLVNKMQRILHTRSGKETKRPARKGNIF